MSKIIITAALTGSRIMRDKAPYIPITAEEISQSAIEAWKAGAAIVHIHVRDPETGLGTQDLDQYKRVVEPLREKTDLVLCLTTSGIPGRNLPIDERLAPLQLRPELASFDAGSINLGSGVFANPPDFLQEAANRMRELGVKPELEVFDLGMIMTCLHLRRDGFLQDPMHFQFVLGTPWGAPATAKAYLHFLDHLPDNATWSTIGIGRGSLPMTTLSMITGGHIRVGMEDNLYLKRGVLATSNAELVSQVRGIVEAYGHQAATPEDAREMLHLKSM
jgi:3-keto-5-aminohexanoate cleavage enzyme